MPLKRKSRVDPDEEKHKNDAPEVDPELDEEDPLDKEEDVTSDEDESFDSSEDKDPESAGKKGPKINFDYEFEGPEIESGKKDQTLEDLANKYRDEPYIEEKEKSGTEVKEGRGSGDEVDMDQAEVDEIPHMRAQMPTSGIYSAQDVRRGSGELHQEPSMRNSFSSHSNGNFRPNSNKSSKIHFVILALIGLVVLGSAVYLLKYQFKQAKPLPTATPAPVVINTPTPSPTPAPIDRSKYTVRILNGTGKSGLAASVSAQLKDLGYKIDKTGNATTTDQTTIKAKIGRDDLIKQLTTDLANHYSASSASAILKSSDSADAEVVVGLK